MSSWFVCKASNNSIHHLSLCASIIVLMVVWRTISLHIVAVKAANVSLSQLTCLCILTLIDITFIITYRYIYTDIHQFYIIMLIQLCINFSPKKQRLVITIICWGFQVSDPSDDITSHVIMYYWGRASVLISRWIQWTINLSSMRAVWETW